MTDVKKLQTLDGMLDYPDPNDASKGTTEQQFQEYLKNSNFAGKNPLHPLKVQAL